MKTAIMLLALAAGPAFTQQPPDSRGWLNQGVQAFKNARYDDAIAAFQQAVNVDPTSVVAHLYLATAYMQRFIPGAVTPENQSYALNAESEFQRVLTLDANNKVALASLASLMLNQHKWPEARDWYNRLLGVDPNNADAYYSLGFIAWSEWYPAYASARQQFGMRPEAPGPLPDGAIKQNLKSQFDPVIAAGIANLNKALEIRPNYSDAMAYINLFIRERADLKSTQAEYQQDIAEADQWVTEALEAKRQQAQQQTMYPAAPPPPPPPPPPSANGQPGQRIIMAGAVHKAKLISQVPPVYPPLALQARIEGVVRLKIIVLRGGSVGSLEVIAGHPLLIPPAMEAVRQWRYQPTLLNGEPVEVQTTVEVNFTLPQ